jgi:hypothetical protein
LRTCAFPKAWKPARENSQDHWRSFAPRKIGWCRHRSSPCSVSSPLASPHEIKNPLNFVNNSSGISAELIGELKDTLKGISLDDKARVEVNELTDTLKSNFDKVAHHGRRADINALVEKSKSCLARRAGRDAGL